MSKLIDKLKKVSQVEPQPMGFGRVHQAPTKPKLLLIAGLVKTEAGKAADADAALLRITDPEAGAKAIKKAAEAASDIPWGAWLKDDGAEIGELVRAGAEFRVFPAESTPLAIPEDKKTGKVLELDPSINQGLLVAVNDLPVDAALIDSKLDKGFLTWHHLMLFQRFADLLTKPLLVSVPSNVTGDELKALWQAGVDGVVVDGAEGKIKELRKLIDETNFPSPRKRVKGEAIIPRMAREAAAHEEAEEEEGDI